MIMYGSSASVSAVAQSADWPGTVSCHQRSRPSSREPAAPARRTTSMCSTFGAWRGRGVGGLLHRHDLAAPVEAVRGDQHLRAAVDQPGGDRSAP